MTTKGKRILIVDDDTDFIAATQAFLEVEVVDTGIGIP
jgi:CheY-like chemotaxis protein